MAEVRGFRGWRYDLGRTEGTADALLSPPYDIIPPGADRALRERSAHNVVHLELPEGPEDLAAPGNRYGRSAALFREWRAAGVLAREEAPALYPYLQEFTLPDGQQHRRLGVLGALRLEPYEAGVVLPHERTFPKHREDRFRLLTAAEAQFSPIMGVYAADAAVAEGLTTATASEPDFSGVDAEGVRHSLWTVTDPEFARWFGQLLADRQVFIADGHHRYETALRYQAERRARGDGSGWHDSMLVYLVAMEDPGLALMPTHRLVRGLPDWAERQLPLESGDLFEVQPAPDGGGAVPAGVVRLVTAGDARDLRLAEVNPLRAEGGHSEAWADLESTLVHRLILEKVLGAGDGLEVVYTRDAEEVRRRVESGEFQVGFLLPAPRVEQLREIALAGDRMPEKTTYFWPKAYAGLVIYGDGAF